jgi:hypothetical protein
MSPPPISSREAGSGTLDVYVNEINTSADSKPELNKPPPSFTEGVTVKEKLPVV